MKAAAYVVIGVLVAVFVFFGILAWIAFGGPAYK